MLCYLLGFANVLKNILYKYSAICSRFIEQYTGFIQATTQLLTIDIPWVIGESFVLKTKVKCLMTKVFSLQYSFDQVSLSLQE